MGFGRACVGAMLLAVFLVGGLYVSNALHRARALRRFRRRRARDYRSAAARS